MKSLLALDFDGVICNSIMECLYTSYAAWLEFSGSPHTDMSEPWRAAFLERRYLVRVGPEFLLLWGLLSANRPIDPLLPLSEQYPVSHVEYTEMEKCFYRHRKQLIAKDLHFYMSMNSIFDGMSDLIRNTDSENRLCIVSSKDSRSIVRILNYNGIHLVNTYIYGREKGEKVDILSKLCNQAPNQPIVFVDDCVENLRKVKNLPLQLVLAEWGYIGPHSFEQAAAIGARICSLQQVTENNGDGTWQCPVC